MKTILYLISTLIFAILTTLSNGNEKKNEHVNVEIKFNKKQLKAGDTAQLTVKFIPKRGIYINANPPIDLKIDSSDTIIVKSKPEIPSSGKSDYFDVTKSIKQSFTLSKKLKTGTVSLRGTLTYFYCSNTDGWCRKYKHPIDMKIKIIK